MKVLAIFFTAFVSIQSSFALTTVIGGTTYSCEPDYPTPPVQKSYYCTIESSFDGSFGGSGKTDLEARYLAKLACKTGSRNNGLFCDENTILCDSSY